MIRCLKCMNQFEEMYGVCPHCGQIPGQEEQEPFELRPGTMLAGRYLIGTAVGVGGFGITYRAWDNTLDKMIAIKEYYPSANGIVNRVPGQSQVIVYAGDRAVEFEKGKQRFLSEARNMAKFNTHPNIVHVFDFFEGNGTAYIAMEFLDGVSYKQFIAANGGVVSQSIALEVTLAVLDALKEIHKTGIIHRDISPDNVFICQGGVIKLIDFGAARFSTGEEEKTLSVILKPGYAPPEQYRSRSRQGPWTDIYAVGAMFYRAVTGKIPEESVNRIVQDNVVPPNQLNPEISANISNSIMRAMALNPELRFRTVDQFKEAIQTKAKVRDVKEELKRRRSLRAVAVGMILVFLLTAGGICAVIFQNKRSQAVLADASLVVWYPVKEEGGNAWEEEETDKAEQSRREFMEKAAAFQASYPNIEITVEPIPAGEYEMRLKTALETGENVPDVFESSCLGEEFYGELAPMKNIYSWLEESEELDNYYFLGQYEKDYPAGKQLPLSFQVPVIYGNSLLEGGLGEKLSEAELREALTESFCSVSAAMLSSWQAFLPELEVNGGYEAFAVDLEEEEQNVSGEEFDAQEEKTQVLQGKAAYYLSDTSEYSRIQQDMAGLYEVYLFDNIPVKGRYTDLWSVYGKASEAERKAGTRLVYFLLSKENQMKLQGGLPLQREALAEFKVMNTEFADIDSCLTQLEVQLLK